MTDNKIINQDFYVITGGPGAGKTTLLEKLNELGYSCVKEAARQIIIEQQRTGGNAFPWGNTETYKKLMLEQSIKDYLGADNKTTTFFDRGIPDTLCYSRLLGQAVTDEEDLAAKQYIYNKKVFMLPPWREIYTTDTERKQDWQEALRTYGVMKETYFGYGYEIIEVPRTIIEDRAAFIIDSIGN
jgi:predicted ATPase